MLCNTQRKMKREKAYDKAIGFIKRNPQLHFCEITKLGILERNVFGNFGYMVKCWKASKDTPLSFRESDGGPVLLFSKSLF